MFYLNLIDCHFRIKFRSLGSKIEQDFVGVSQVGIPISSNIYIYQTCQLAKTIKQMMTRKPYTKMELVCCYELVNCCKKKKKN